MAERDLDRVDRRQRQVCMRDRSGDVLVAIDGKLVLGVRDLLEKVSFHKPGDTLKITVYRGQEKFTFKTIATQRPS